MVENSLGKLALESTGINENIKDNWKYYIDSEKEENSEKIWDNYCSSSQCLSLDIRKPCHTCLF